MLFNKDVIIIIIIINRHGNFKGLESRVTRENSKSRITLLCLCLIKPHADNLSPITRHGKPLCHAVIEEEAVSLLYLRLFSLEFQPIFIRLMLLIQDRVTCRTFTLTGHILT